MLVLRRLNRVRKSDFRMNERVLQDLEVRKSDFDDLIGGFRSKGGEQMFQVKGK